MVLAAIGPGLVDHLGGAGLAGDLEPGDRGGDAGAIAHRRHQALVQEGPDQGRELDVARDLAGVAPEQALAGPLDALDQPRLPAHAAVGDR
jgi:hypothetical protein